MVKRNRPKKKIIEICRDLQQNGRNLKAFATFHQAVMRDRSTQLASVIYNCLNDQHLEDAVALANQYDVYLDPNIFQSPLISALRATKDVESYIELVRYIHDNYNRKDEIESVTDEVADITEVLGNIVYNTFAALPGKQQSKLFSMILNGLVEEGLTISKTQAERICSKIDLGVGDQISLMLTQLSSGELQPVPVEKIMRKALTSECLERIIKLEVERGNDIKQLRHWLLGFYYNARNVFKYTQCLEELENKNIYFTKSYYVNLIKYQAYTNDLCKALDTFDKVREKIPQFVLDSTKTLNIAYLLVEKNETERALKWLKANKKSVTAADESECSQSKNILKHLAEEGRTQDLQKIFESLVVNNFVKVDNVSLGPLIKVHLVNDDISSAMDTIEKFVNEYKLTPMVHQLYSKLIENKDQTTLQRAVDISSRIHGKHNSLLLLTFSYV